MCWNEIHVGEADSTETTYWVTEAHHVQQSKEQDADFVQKSDGLFTFTCEVQKWKFFRILEVRKIQSLRWIDYFENI